MAVDGEEIEADGYDDEGDDDGYDDVEGIGHGFLLLWNITITMDDES